MSRESNESDEPHDRDGRPVRRCSADALDASVRLARLRRQMFADVENPRIAHYHVLRQIGGGSSGVVFAAWDPSLDRVIAIKLLRDSSLPHAGQQLRREAEAWAQLRHPNVVELLELGDHDGQVFLAMEHISGQPLRQWLVAWRAGPRDIRALVDVFLQVGRGLAAAHEAGLVHRNVTPDNVLIDAGGRVRLIDFGLTRAALEVEVRREPHTGLVSLNTVATRQASRVGSPAYMAPEQLRGEAPSSKTDQYAVCACLFEALVGRTVRSRRTDETPVVVPRQRGVPRRLHEIVRRGLSDDANARWPSMTALVQALQRRRAWALPRGTFVGVLGLGTIAVGVGFVLARDEGARCRDSLDDIWGPDAQADVARAFELTSNDALASRTRARLDQYATNWSELYEASCKATFVNRTLPERSFERRMQCLELTREALRVEQVALGPEHVDVGIAWFALGESLVHHQRHQEAHQALQQARSIFASTLGADHPIDRRALLRLCEVERELGRLHETTRQCNLLDRLPAGFTMRP